MAPLVPGLMAHVSSAMAHLVMDVRASACSFLDLLVQHYPDMVVSSFSGQVECLTEYAQCSLATQNYFALESVNIFVNSTGC